MKYDVEQQELDLQLQELEIQSAKLELEDLEDELEKMKSARASGTVDGSGASVMNASLNLSSLKGDILASVMDDTTSTRTTEEDTDGEKGTEAPESKETGEEGTETSGTKENGEEGTETSGTKETGEEEEETSGTKEDESQESSGTDRFTKKAPAVRKTENGTNGSDNGDDTGTGETGDGTDSEESDDGTENSEEETAMKPKLARPGPTGKKERPEAQRRPVKRKKVLSSLLRMNFPMPPKPARIRTFLI